jgi:hypothetical protein
MKSLYKIAILKMLWASAFCAAQTAPMHAFSTSSPRPLLDLIEQINHKFGTVISYEDPPIIYPGALVDVTTPEYKGSGRAFRMITNPVSVEFTDLLNGGQTSSEQSADVERFRTEQRNAVSALLGAYAKSGNLGTFAAIHTGKYSEVFPTVMRDENGQDKPFNALLSTPVHIARGSYRLDTLIWLVCQQIAEARNVTIIHGTTPTGMLLSITVKVDGLEKSAREVLVEAFEDANAFRLSHGADNRVDFRWDLLYDPGFQTFAMNIGWARRDLSEAVPRAAIDASKPSDATKGPKTSKNTVQ